MKPSLSSQTLRGRTFGWLTDRSPYSLALAELRYLKFVMFRIES